MKYLCWGLLLLPFFLNCATHAPMSEMVMFHQYLESDSTQNIDLTGLAIFQPKPDLQYFEDKKDVEFFGSNQRLPFINIYGTRLYSSKLGFSASLGESIGLDGTIKLAHNFYGTVGISAMNNRAITLGDFFTGRQLLNVPRNYLLAIQQPVIQNARFSMSMGAFYQRDTKAWNKYYPPECENICSGNTEYGTLSLDSFGFKTTLFLSTGQASFFSGNLRFGKLINESDYYLSVGMSFNPYLGKL